MLKIYDQNKNPLGYIVKYSDDCIESDLSNGDKTLSFTYLAKKAKDIQNEYYVETKDDRYVVKEVGVSSNNFPTYKCQLDLEDLEADMFESFSALNVTLEDAANLALAGTGWIVDTDITKIRSVATMKATPFTILGKIRDAWMCEIRYDNKKKVVYFREKFGEDKGVYLTRSLNLRKINLINDSYDYYTRIVPIGADGLRISDVNDGKMYVENYQYSNKVRTLIWEDTSYEDAQALKEDAERKLEDLSKPKKSYSADVIDLAKQNSDYSILSLGLGDTVLLLDERTGIKDKQRIVKLTEYPHNPEKNSCEMSNTTLTFEEQQERLQAAADAVENITNADGTVNGVYVHGVEADGVVGIETVINNSSSVQSLNTQVAEVQSGLSIVNGELSIAVAKIGTLETTALTAATADLRYATIERADILEADIHALEVDYGDFKTLTANEFAAQNAIINDLETNKLSAVDASIQYAKINLSNIERGCITTAMLGTAVVGTEQIADSSITDAKIVELTANKITAGTLSVERLEIRGSENSIVYALNNITGALQAQNVDTLNGEILTPRSITADRIVANSITGDEIAAQTILANHINVTDLFAQDITATGIIRGVQLVGVSGDFTGKITAQEGTVGGWNILKRCMYSKNAATGTTVVLQNADVGVFEVGTATGENCSIEIEGNVITVIPDGSGDPGITVSIPIYGTGKFVLVIKRRYKGDVSNFEETVDVSTTYAETGDGTIIEVKSFTIAPVLGGTENQSERVNDFEYEITEEAKSLEITHRLSGVPDESYEIEFYATLNDMDYITNNVVSGILSDAVIAIKKEVNSEILIPFLITRDGVLYSKYDIYEGGTALSSKYLSLSGGTLTKTGSNTTLTVTTDQAESSIKYTSSYSSVQWVVGPGAGYADFTKFGFYNTSYGAVAYLDVTGNLAVFSDITAVRGHFYGAYVSDTASRFAYSALEIREAGCVGTAQSDIGYSPSIGFHWSGRCAGTLILDSSASFQFLNQQGANAPVWGSFFGANSFECVTAGNTAAIINVHHGGIYGQLVASRSNMFGLYNVTANSWIVYGVSDGAVFLGHERVVIPPTGNSGIRGYDDNSYACGHSSYRWTYVFAKNGTIQTSDEREKDILSELTPADLSAYFMSLEPIAYRWNYGTDRTIHFGLGAQTSKRKLEQAGYSAEDFSLIQHDYLEEPSVLGLTDRYSMDYQAYNILTMAQCQINTRAIERLTVWKDTTDIELANILKKQEEREMRIQNLEQQVKNLKLENEQLKALITA